MDPLVSVVELAERLPDRTLRIVDTRFDLATPAAGKAAYQEGHIPGASFMDLDEDLSSPAPSGTPGGRHPLPDLQVFVAALERRGIGNGSEVVVYDGSAGMFAGRLWWMLRLLGHDRVRVLDGGIQAWIAAGQPLTRDLPVPEKAAFTPRMREEMMVGRDYVLRNLDNPDLLLVDARENRRYRGEIEPIDTVGGHIPGALNLPFAGNLDGGRFLPPEALAGRFEAAREAERVVVYCGSGVSAIHNLLALERAGITGAKLYVGSWSDWISYPGAPVATGEEP